MELSELRIELSEFIPNLIIQAGQLILKMKQKPFKYEEKNSYSDLVTIVDKAVEEFLVSSILEKFPTHGILGEEGTFQKDWREFETLWVIDPIDGTTNFIHDIPFYAVSIGVIHKGEELLGAVYNPVTEELFFATKGQGAYLNGERLKLEGPLTLHQSLFSTSMFWQNPKTKNQLHSGVIDLYNNSRGVRMVGGAALSLCDVARGRLSGYIMPMLSAWDYAAGKVIVQEAGGIVTDLNGSDFLMNQSTSVVASHPAIHKEVLSLFETKKEEA